jgi:hypothetical protein
VVQLEYYAGLASGKTLLFVVGMDVRQLVAKGRGMDQAE